MLKMHCVLCTLEGPKIMPALDLCPVHYNEIILKNNRVIKALLNDYF